MSSPSCPNSRRHGKCAGGGFFVSGNSIVTGHVVCKALDRWLTGRTTRGISACLLGRRDVEEIPLISDGWVREEVRRATNAGLQFFAGGAHP